MFLARTAFVATLVGLASVAVFTIGDANAQQIYRIVGPDGRITFSDQPPLDATKGATPAKTVPLPGAGVSTGNAALPFELRQAASRYPVTLYSAPSCAPCGAGRALLSSRGIPFAEKTVTTNEDIDALKRLATGATLPMLTIGGQQLRGFSEAEWTQFLDAAGYPKTSQLPSGYAQAPAAPLVAADQPQRARPAPDPTAALPQALPPPAPEENPAGIKF
jgi:glutaredoxin